MGSKHHTAAQSIEKVRQVERMLAEGLTVEQAVARIDVSVNTYYRWKRRFQGMGHSPSSFFPLMPPES